MPAPNIERRSALSNLRCMKKLTTKRNLIVDSASSSGTIAPCSDGM